MADLYAITEQQLTDIADAIRAKRDTVAPMTVDDMPLEISLIDGGGGIEPYYSQDSDITTDLTSGTHDIKIPAVTPDGHVGLVTVEFVGEPPASNAFRAGGFMIHIYGTKGNSYANITLLASGTSLTGSNSYGVRCAAVSATSKYVTVRFTGNASYPIYHGTYRLSIYDISDLFGG